jgi:tRNA-2-methylthio-N6-dimethylallyladenosine synthase
MILSQPEVYKKLVIITYGCQMNVYDSTQMQNIMVKLGYVISEDIQDADLVIMNTCNIREKAAEKVYSELGKIRKLKENRIKNNQQMVIVLAGCVGQAEGEEVFRRAPYVDIVVGPQSYQTLPNLIKEVEEKSHKVINLDFKNEEKFNTLPEELLSQGISAFVTIQEGWDKFCKFCSVPYTRGAEYSRPVSQIYREVLKLAAQGSQEIILLGQNVNAYHGQTDEGQTFSLADLIKHIAKINGIKRIRYTTSHPVDMSDDLIALHGDEPKLMPLIHLPIQTGSNKLLKAMGRNHTVEFYLGIVEKCKEARADIKFSSDFIEGYPGETEDDLRQTLDIIEKVEFTQGYAFKYSKRLGTPAPLIEDATPSEVIDQRLFKVQELLMQQQIAFNRSFIEKEVEILVEKIIEERGQVMGKTPYMQNVYIKGGKDLYGKTIMVKIFDANKTNLKGEMISDEMEIAC